VILVDTSIWVDHFRRVDVALSALLLEGSVACHPFVVGELACGNLANRKTVLSLLSALPTLSKASDREALEFIERHRISGRGIGLIDVHLLASCMLDNALLWARDKRLADVAAEMGLAYVP
jgi:predicted nucleic acid-binding protein